MNRTRIEGWTTVDNHHIEKSYSFPDFRQALDFVNKVGAVAEELGHHPDILLRWGEVRVQSWTHDESAITEKDYRLAESIDQI